MAKFPLCAATHDQGLRWLFDFAAIALLLDCRPGDRVLDLGAGSGFSSEMLARFGYDVVAIDPDLAALGTNRRRPCFDARRIDGRVAVAGAAAEALPFPERSFDGVFCMNVLHHLPDLSRVTSELARVLRPGCRVVFCEPGLDHLQASETQRAIREHGEGDQPFDVMQFLADARACGFADAMLSATLQSALRLLPIQEVPLYASGQHPRPHLTPAGVIDELHRRHAYGMLVREGARERTSRYPGTLRADLQVVDLPSRFQQGRTYEFDVHATNSGDSVWLSRPHRLGGFVTVGCKLLRPDGRLVTDAIGRTFLPHDVAPGADVQVRVSFEPAAGLEPGAYVVSVDLVNELVCWFSDLPGNAAVQRAIVVETTDYTDYTD